MQHREVNLLRTYVDINRRPTTTAQGASVMGSMHDGLLHAQRFLPAEEYVSVLRHGFDGLRHNKIKGGRGASIFVPHDGNEVVSVRKREGKRLPVRGITRVVRALATHHTTYFAPARLRKVMVVLANEDCNLNAEAAAWSFRMVQNVAP